MPALSGKQVASRTIQTTNARAYAEPRILDSALSRLRDSDPDRYHERIEELAYLANVLIAAPRNQRERQRPVEALESALETANRGLERALGLENRRSDEERTLSAITVLSTTTADCLFRLGFPDAGTNVKR